MDGYVLRLIPAYFSNDLELFSTAEILRCPLDKLVLRIKLLDKYYLKNNE